MSRRWTQMDADQTGEDENGFILAGFLVNLGRGLI